MEIKHKLSLFATALLQVGLVAMNVIFLTHDKVILMLLTGFFISFTWSYNIKKIAFGGNYDRLIYCFGAMCGSGIGYYFSNYLKTIL